MTILILNLEHISDKLSCSRPTVLDTGRICEMLRRSASNYAIQVKD